MVRVLKIDKASCFLLFCLKLKKLIENKPTINSVALIWLWSLKTYFPFCRAYQEILFVQFVSLTSGFEIIGGVLTNFSTRVQITNIKKTHFDHVLYVINVIFWLSDLSKALRLFGGKWSYPMCVEVCVHAFVQILCLPLCSCEDRWGQRQPSCRHQPV